MRRAMNAVVALVIASAVAGCKSSTESTVANGSLAFGQPTYTATTGSSVTLQVTLAGNTGTSGVTVTIASSNPAVAVPVQTPCVLSDEAGSTSSCEVQVKALTPGAATISASAPGVTGSSATVQATATPVPGTLAFTPASESVVAGNGQQITLKLVGSSGISGHVVFIASSSTAIATVSRSQCVLSSDVPTCPVTVNGVAQGSTTIVASSAGYTSATNTVTVTPSGGTVAGTLSFGGNVQVAVNGVKGATLNLVGSSNVAQFTAAILLQNANATASRTSCPLSSAAPICSFTVTGVSAGSDRISATASGYTGPSMIASVTADPVKGNLYFEKSSETVSVGANTKVNLVYSGGSGVASVPVTLQTSNGFATIQPTTCNLNNLSGPTSCTITITGVGVGGTTITAQATGYPNVTNEVVVQSGQHVDYGTLAFSPANPLPIVIGGNVQLALQLQGSTNVNSLPVTIRVQPAGIVQLDKTACTLSTSSDSCTVTATAIANGTATLTTTSQGPASQATATVAVDPAAAPALVFSPSTLILSNQSIAASSVKLTLANPPATGSATMIIHNSLNIQMSVIPDPCILSAATPTCALSINNATAGATPASAWLTAASSMLSDLQVPYAELPVSIAQPGPTTRTLTVVNNCSYDVYAGISGGSVASVTPVQISPPAPCPSGMTPTTITPNTYCCPTGSTAVSTGAGLQCFWNNPVPDNGYHLATGQTTHFVIPADSLTTASGLTDVWSGTLMARLQCDANGNCAIGTCNGNTNCPTGGCTGGGGTGLACVPGTGFQSPATVAEFTLEQGQTDAYDVQAITGAIVPTSMGPTVLDRDPTNPYTAGTAGSPDRQAGTLYTLPASSWTFSPPAIGSPASSNFFTIVAAIAPTPPAPEGCTSDAGCTAPDVCGYAQNSIQALTSMPGTNPTYTRTCGPRLGYLSPDAIWKGNADVAHNTNLSPLGFYTAYATGPLSPTNPYPNTQAYPLHQFIDCPNPPMDSGYQPATTFPYACGCTNWDGIAAPTSTCVGTGVTVYDETTAGIGFNSAWLTQVLPNISWVKQGCPTCYAYQFDDASSSFQAYSPANKSNASNGTGYTITFCPNASSSR